MMQPILSLTFTLTFTVLLSSFNVLSLSESEIKKAINNKNAYEFIGLGGRYGYMANVVSKQGLIESDHFPPKAVYKSAKDNHVKKLADPKENGKNMAAVSLRYLHHRDFITTNNPRKGSVQEMYIRGLHQLFEAGNYYEAIRRNIVWYKENPDKEGNSRTRFDQFIKVGIKDALEVHVINGLITQQQKSELINSNALDVTNPVLTNILNIPARDRARELILADIQDYKRRALG